jgi:hypothetical protein
MANWLAGVAPYLALHSADPGPAGLNETTAPRVAANWPEPVGGALQIPGKVFSGGEPLGPITHVGFWSAPTGGIIYASGLLSGDQQFNANGVYNLLSANATGSSIG